MNVPPERKFDIVSGLSLTYCSQPIPSLPRVRRVPEEDDPVISPVPARPIVSDPLLTRIFQERLFGLPAHDRLSVKSFVNLVVSSPVNFFNHEQVESDELLPVSV